MKNSSITADNGQEDKNLWLASLGAVAAALSLCVSPPHTANADMPISTAAYPLLAERVTANQGQFLIYENADSGFNHGFPSGFFGAIDKIDIDAACIDDVSAANGCSTDPNRLDQEHGTVLRISFDPQSPGIFSGINIEEPENWGAHPRGVGYDLRGATHLVLEVRSPTPGGVRVQFGVGGRTTDFLHISQSATYTTLSIPLSSLNLSEQDLANTHILFTVVTNDHNAPNGGTVLIDNLRLEPVPLAQQNALGFPLSTKTSGVIPRQSPASGRVPIPPDQVNRNLTTGYESALTVMALLTRGTSEDLRHARLIADTFDYALHHDNHGDPLPAAPDGAVGLHNGYESGDIALLNSQGPGAGQAGEVRLAGFSAPFCGASGFCLVLDGATGGNNAFAILALVSTFNQFHDMRYLDDARSIGNWIAANLTDTAGTGFAGYVLGYPDEGVPPPKPLITGKSIENNADIYAAFLALADRERALGNDAQADEWTRRANVAGDFVMAMFDPTAGRFYAGTVPVGTPSGPGITPDGPRRGNDIINTADFLDSQTFTALALAESPRYRAQIDWRRPVQYILDTFAQSITVGSHPFQGFNLVQNPTAGPVGIAWEFTAQAVAAMRFVDQLYSESRFAQQADFYLEQIRQAQVSAPFGDGRGLVAAILQDGDRLPPYEQCLSTPFQCIPERVGLAATTWAIFAEQNVNVLVPQPAAAPNGPDLTGSWQNLTQTCKGSGASLRCKLKGSLLVRNQGTETAPRTHLQFFLSPDAGLDGNDVLLKQVGVKSLQTNKSKRIKLKVTLPVGSNATGQFVIAVVDATDAVAESDEANNVISAGPLP